MIVPPDIVDLIITVAVIILVVIVGLSKLGKYIVNMIHEHDEKAWWDEHV